MVINTRCMFSKSNPRASRTAPFVATSDWWPVAKVAAKVMTGLETCEQGITSDPTPSHISVKESVFPFIKFSGVDIVLGPEMKSTGEVNGQSATSSRSPLPKHNWPLEQSCPKLAQSSSACINLRSKTRWSTLAKRLVTWASNSWPTSARDSFEQEGIPVERVKKLAKVTRTCSIILSDGRVQLIMNTPGGNRCAYRRRQNSCCCRTKRRAMYHDIAPPRKQRSARWKPSAKAKLTVQSIQDRLGVVTPIISRCKVVVCNRRDLNSSMKLAHT